MLLRGSSLGTSTFIPADITPAIERLLQVVAQHRCAVFDLCLDAVREANVLTVRLCDGCQLMKHDTRPSLHRLGCVDVTVALCFQMGTSALASLSATLPS